jgi:tRNA-specific 2-thiouridylase
VAAWLLREQGHRVIGVTLGLWNDVDATHERSCCSPVMVAKAKAVADHLGIPHLVVDKVDDFRKEVVDYFVSEYTLGRTPNPCVKCNAKVRFTALLDVARRLGADLVATGHYARLSGAPARLSRGRDQKKDQSYVLAEVSPDLLEKVVFPLGELRKEQVRLLAAEAGVRELVSGESQEICFIPDDDYRNFLRARLGERPGIIVDRQGLPIGRHEGTYGYTIGQRRGLGPGGGPPLYVVSMDAERSEIVAGPASAGTVREIVLSSVVTHREGSTGDSAVQCRSMGGSVPARLTAHDTVLLDEPARGIAPGQMAVIYDGDDVVLAGTIVRTVW